MTPTIIAVPLSLIICPSPRATSCFWATASPTVPSGTSFDNRHIKNRGIVGDIVQGYIDRMEPILKGQPKKIFIMGGVNDISHGVTGDSIARVTEKLIMLIKERSPRTRIYLQSLLPFNNDFGCYKRLVGREHVVPG